MSHIQGSRCLPPKVKCLTRIWHPNITETGEICLRVKDLCIHTRLDEPLCSFGSGKDLQQGRELQSHRGNGSINSAFPKVRAHVEGAWLRRTGLCLWLLWPEAAPCSPLCLCVCFSLLREHSIDGTGWAPTRTLKDVVWGLNSLFTEDFRNKVEDYIKRYAR
ncbi:hypothetical protein MC885_017605 [Smutsia gigantea]|nr:hypothetical protein MC885_017605 [Smutsia gigantea]